MTTSPWVSPARLAPLVTALVDGSLDLHTYVDDLCDRIEQVEPHVKAYVVEHGRRERLHAEAEEAVRRWPEPATRPALFGTPVAVKDIVHVDGLPTRAGSGVPPEVLAGPQAVLVDRLRAAGALVAGKSVTAEFANFTPNETRNPHDLARTPGGSSSGSAAAVAAGTAVLGTGTQTVGSVVRPAAYCGVVGWKSTHGRVPKAGVIDHSPSLDVLGMFSADGAGAVGAARVCLGADWNEPEPLQRPLRVATPVGEYLGPVEPEARSVFERQVAALAAAGHTVREVPVEALLGPWDDLLAHNQIVNRYELAQTHEQWFDRHRAGYREQTAAAIDHGRSITPERYAQARRHLEDLRARVDDRLRAAQVDLLVAPAAPGPAPLGIDSTGDPAMARPWTYAGLPAISLPGGTTSEGLPLGLQLVGPTGSDEWLLSVALEVEPHLSV